MLTGSIVLIWTFGAEEERSRWPNWFRWSSSLDRKLGGMGMDLDGDTVEWQIDLQSIKWMKMCSNEKLAMTFHLIAKVHFKSQI